MDQIYLPKSRPPGFAVGSLVELIPTLKEKVPFYTHSLPHVEPIKIQIINEIFNYFEHVDNVIITGSFLEKGFNFSDIDVIIVDEIKANQKWEEHFLEELGVKIHIICMDRNSLIKGLRTDPLFQMMLSKYISKKRELFRIGYEFNYKQLDLHLHHSQTLIAGFDSLSGKEKYNLTRNLFAIKLFLDKQKVNIELVDLAIERAFGKSTVEKLKNNLMEKKSFLPRFKSIYAQTLKTIMTQTKHASK